jgi:hypothetical protein
VALRKIIAAYCNNYTKRTNTLYRQNKKVFNIEGSGKNTHRSLLKPQIFKELMHNIGLGLSSRPVMKKGRVLTVFNDVTGR